MPIRLQIIIEFVLIKSQISKAFVFKIVVLLKPYALPSCLA